MNKVLGRGGAWRAGREGLETDREGETERERERKTEGRGRREGGAGIPWEPKASTWGEGRA